MDTELREKILVVEDEASLRELLQYNLRKRAIASPWPPMAKTACCMLRKTSQI
jgi:DNA-binding response OmpR family regulator